MREEEKKIISDLDSYAGYYAWFGWSGGYGYGSYRAPEFASGIDTIELPADVPEEYMSILEFVLILFEMKGVIDCFSLSLPDGLKYYSGLIRYRYLVHNMEKYGWYCEPTYSENIFLSHDETLPLTSCGQGPSRELMVEVINNTYADELPDMYKHKSLKRLALDKLCELYDTALEGWYDNGDDYAGFLTVRNRRVERFIKRRPGHMPGVWWFAFRSIYEKVCTFYAEYTFWEHENKDGSRFFINLLPSCACAGGIIETELHEYIPLSVISDMELLDEMMREVKKGRK